MAVALAGVAFKTKTANGTIVVSNVPAGAEVTVEGAAVTVTHAGDTVTLSEVPADGQGHRLRVAKGGVELFAKDVAVTVGGQRVEVRYEAKAPGGKAAQAATVPPPAEAVFKGYEGRVAAIGFAPDGKTLITGGNSLFKKLEDKGGQKSNVNYPGEDNVVRFWDVADARHSAAITRGLGQRAQWPVQGFTLSPDGSKLAVASCRPGADFCEATVTVWSLATKGRLNHFPLPGRAGVWAPWFSADGRTAYAFRGDTTVHVLDLVAGKESTAMRLDPGAAEGALRCATMSRDRTLAFVGLESGEVQLRAMSDGGKLVRDYRGHTKAVRAISLSEDGKYLASAGDDSSARVWEVATGKAVCVCRHGDQVLGVAFVAGAERIVTCGSDQTAALWRVADGSQIKRFEGHTDAIRCLAVSPDGRVLATGSADKTARTWNLPQ